VNHILDHFYKGGSPVTLLGESSFWAHFYKGVRPVVAWMNLIFLLISSTLTLIGLDKRNRPKINKALLINSSLLSINKKIMTAIFLGYNHSINWIGSGRNLCSSNGMRVFKSRGATFKILFLKGVAPASLENKSLGLIIQSGALG